MHIFSRLTLIAVAALALGSCQKQVEYSGSADVQPVLPDPITANIQGGVVDENGQPAANVTVRVGSKTATTDINGQFRILAASLDKKQALVTAEKNGYFKAYRSFGATSGANAVQIKLIPRSLTGSVSGTTGGDATLANGSKVSLPANGIVDATTGAAYTGSVNVYAAYIDPSASDISQVIPGSLTANDKDGRRVTLTSYGMLAVELEGAAGQKLQIKTGSNAVLTTAIPSAAQASAPATIPMWYVDEATGIWKEQGTATKVGNTYVGNVPHFSFWNCDVSANAVQVTITLHTAAGVPLPHTWVRLRRAGTGWSSWSSGFTDSLGQVSGYVPNNEPLVLEVMDRCYQVFYTQNLGPYTANTVVPTITVTVPGTQLTTITGQLLNCNAAPVTNGYAIIQIGNGWTTYAGVNATGHFSVQYVSCSSTTGNVNVVGIDNGSQVQSSTVTVPFTSGTVNVGTVTACGTSAAQYINFTIDGGTPQSITSSNPNDSLTLFTQQVQGATLWQTQISGFTSTSNTQIYLMFTGANAPGTYAVTNISVNASSTQPIVSNVNTTVTTWPATVGSFMEGTLSGNFTDNTGPHTITGSYRLRRNF